MLFAISYEPRGDVTEEVEKRSLQLFTNWTPPTGYEIKAHYSLSDGSGGLTIVEVDSAATLLEAASPWGPFLKFKTVPIVDIAETVPIAQKAYAWRDTVH